MADLSMETAVVEPVDVVSHRDLEIVDTPARATIPDQFLLEQLVHRFGHRVAAIAFRTELVRSSSVKAGSRWRLATSSSTVLALGPRFERTATLR